MNTQYINRVELQGRVGTVRISPVHDTIVANFSVMTEHMYQTSDGNKVVEATDASGAEKVFTEVLASSLKVLG